MNTSCESTPLALECIDRALGLEGRPVDSRTIEAIAVDVRREWGLPEDAALGRFWIDGREVSELEWLEARQAIARQAIANR